MELRNPITRAILDRLRPRPLVAEVLPADFGPGWVRLGLVPAGFLVASVVVEVVAPFDLGAALSVGDAVAHGRFQTTADNVLIRAGQYEARSHFQGYPADTDAFVYLIGASTGGRAIVTAYLE